jgi:RimJ/RimL family protein N-acetyltransferase
MPPERDKARPQAILAPVTLHETPRLRLRELVAEDAAFILELVNEPGWIRFIGDRNVHTLEDARGYIERGPMASYAKHGYGLWGVELLASGEPVGMCGLVRRESLPQADLGFAFLARHWGRGYAREAAAAVVELARERFHLPQLLAITDPQNTASQTVLERVGFHFEKPFRFLETGEDLSLYARELA